MGEPENSARTSWNVLSNKIETTAKLLAAIIALIAAIGFSVPPIGKLISLVTAWRLGATGYVYYGVNENMKPTSGGNLHLLREGKARFADIRWGDRLQAAYEKKEFRERPTRKGRTIFHLKEGECVIVISRDQEIIDKAILEDAVSGGWLRVATTACGLFSK